MPEQTIHVEHFAQIRRATVPIRDLVVLVGPQATGKSLILQLFKLAQDRSRIARRLRDASFLWDTPEEFLGHYFGGGFQNSWPKSAIVSVGSVPLTAAKAASSKKLQGEDSVFYVPAHRTLAMPAGWPRQMLEWPPHTPFMARRYGAQLLELLNRGLGGPTGTIFPPASRLKAPFREILDRAVFHGGELRLDTSTQQRQFMLEYGDHKIPFMAWTAGQREFIPLLMGLYHLLPSSALSKNPDVEWVVIEEPEMGLHPKAVVAVMATVLDLLHRNYRVALSTHSPTVLDVLWALRMLKGSKGAAQRLCEIFGLAPRHDVVAVMNSALAASVSVTYLDYDETNHVTSTDISDLDPASDDANMSGWGGLTDFPARVSAALLNTPPPEQED